ncbi:restriction endonuclease subunit S [Geobacter sulfurreducens subsp. ethanolicus]|uniref:restriction endonuclease subunit S n=1 Tax=Geobacter sulfurreducens TaxID=35554 RepID=UPI00257271BF|nr:restriction endonuclease subunit S [Geobacter sulfurreducens]BEH09841.1 restriction endonuclease subunit S [Geobacter sulfurreducens subsp. ethanolicus]
MDAQQFLVEFGHISNAPGGVARLRELILALAVQGKLVSQDFTDVPASELLKGIYAEKNQLMKDGKLKARQQLQPIKPDEISCAQPKGWELARLGDIAEIERGGSPRPIESFITNDPDGLNWIKIGDTEKGSKFITSTKEKIKKEGLTKTRMVYPGDFLLTNSMSFGRPYIAAIEGCIHDGWLRIHPPSSLDKNYLYHLLSSPLVANFFQKAAAGAVVQNLNADKVRDLPIPLPPLTEQFRIAAKVDELMALCDKLEVQQQKRRTLQNSLRLSTLQSVSAATSPYELQTTWERLAENLGCLLQSPEDVEDLRNLILDLAVHGLLVDQTEMDKSITEWLEEILSKKTELVKKKLIGKQTALADVDENDYPFPLPKGWTFVRLGQITNKIGSGSTPRGGREVYVKEGIPFLRSQNIWNDGLRLADVAFITPTEHARMSGTAVLANDVLLNITGASLGRCALVPDDFGEANVSQHVTIIRPTDPSVKEYLHLCLLSPYSQAMIWGRQVGMAREGLSKKVLEQFEIPLPPLTEQKRIVTRVTQLMGICDQLESRLKDARHQAERLAIACVSSLTGITSEQEEEDTMKVPQTELIATLRLGQIPDIKSQAPLATILARNNGEMSAKDMCVQFCGLDQIDSFYSQLKTEVAHGWVQEPNIAEMREKITSAAGA